MKKLVMVAMAVVMGLSLVADTWTDPDTGYTWTYRINGDAELYNGSCNSAISPKPIGAVTIPSTLGGKPVTSIGGYAFYCCSGLTSVTIPNSVTSIGGDAFSGCSGLTSVTIPNSVTSIGYRVFSGCSGLTSVTIPDSVTSIGDYVFSGCSGLTSVTIPNSVTSIGWHAFESCSGLTSVTIPDSVTSIGESAFYNCSGLTNVTIGSGLMSIGDRAFNGCGALSFIIVAEDNVNYLSANGLLLSKDGKMLVKGINGDVTIPNGVTNICESAFAGCSGLTSVTIPDSVTSIGFNAFQGCSDSFYDTATIPGVRLVDGWVVGYTDSLAGTVSLTGVRGIGRSAFSGCTSLTRVTIPNSVTSIGHGVFSGCKGLTGVTMPDSVTSIGEYAFNGCSRLTSVTIPNSVTNIGSSAFSGCGLKGVSIGGGVTGIGNRAFYGCRSLSNVTIPDSVVSIGSSVFSGCIVLRSITVLEGNASYSSANGLLLSKDGKTLVVGGNGDVAIPNGVMSVGDYAFSGFSGLISVTMPSSVTSIGSHAFENCSSLASLIIPNCVTNVEDYAFYGCSGLTSVTIGSGLMRIGDYAFNGCSGLTSVTIPGSVECIGTRAFQSCFNLARVRINNGVKDIGDSAFGGCKFTNVEIPDSVTNIGSGAFMMSQYLTSAKIGNGVKRIGDYAFFQCSNLANVEIGSGVTSIGGNAFSGCAELTRVSMPSGIMSIEANAFSGCSKLESINIPDTVTNIGSSAFLGCSDSLYDTTAIAGVKLVDGWVVGFTDSLSGSVDLTGVRGLAEGAFQCCGGLTDVMIPDNVPSIGTYTFRLCSELTSVTIPKSVTHIGDFAFSDCRSLTCMEIPDSVRGIGANAFYGCSGLGSVTFYGEAPAGLSESGILINTSSVRYPRRYASSFESVVPASKFGGYLPMEVDELLNAFEWNFSQDLERPWSSDYGVSYDGEGSMRSGRIANDESTWIETTVNGPGRLSFWWKASSEEYDGEVFDYAYLSVDGVPQGTLDNYRLNGVAIGGKTDWTNVVFDVMGDGEHTIRWTYCKDEMDESDVGEDCAWLDEVSFVPYVSLTFDLAEGVGIVPDAKFLAMGSTLSLPKSEGFSRSKYRFVGWSDGTKVYEAGAEYVVSDSNVEFSAVWEAKTLSAPTISSADVENGGMHESAYALISIAAEAGASIYYTVDGAEPTTNGIFYVAPIMALGMTEIIRAIAVRDDYFDSAISEFAFSRKPYSAEECLNVVGLTVSTGGGDAAWSRVLGMAAHDGVAAMRSGAMGDGESSSIEMTVVGAGEIGFWWKSSSEISRNRKFDYVSFLIDGVEQSWMGGEMDWTNETFAVTGSGAHTFKWVYQKNDNGKAQGEDCAWVDEVTWMPSGVANIVVDVGGGKSVTVPGAWIEEHSALVEAAGGDASAALAATAANGRKVWECYALGLDPEDNSSTNDFKITSFPLKADGTPDIEHIVFDPPQARWNVPATYKVKGAANLNAADWPEVTEQNKASFRFFKVEVVLP